MTFPPADIGTTPGVSFTPPPTHLLDDALRVVNDSIAQLSPGANGGVVGVGTVDNRGRVNYNAAVVIRKGEDFAVVTWIGKKWDEGVTYGGGLKWEF